MSSHAVPKELRNDPKVLTSGIVSSRAYQDVRIRGAQPLKTVDGREGWEAVIDARDSMGAQPLVVYSADVLGDDGTITVTYERGPKHEAKYLAAAKAAARSIKVQPPEHEAAPPPPDAKK
jgi:hypothetical protein